MNPFCRGCAFAVPLAVVLWLGIIWLGLSCIGCSSKATARIIGVQKEVQQHTYEHLDAQRDAINKSVQNAGIKDSTVVIGVIMLAIMCVLVFLGVRILLKHDERWRMQCKYPGATATVSP